MIHPLINNLLRKNTLYTAQDYENAIKEIIQQTVLAGLWRAGFFSHAAFYGGSALRIFYGLQRFSEDLDFTLIRKKSDFELTKYFSAIRVELSSLGFEVDIEKKIKKIARQTDSAFIKMNTLLTVINAGAPDDIVSLIPKGKVLKVKFEIDVDPPYPIASETKFLIEPLSCSVNVVTLPDLFAGKVHALLYRNWKNRVKGRDWYDFIWFVASDIKLNIAYLSKRIIQSENKSSDFFLDKENCKVLLRNAVDNLNIDSAKRDVLPFLKNTNEVDIWSKDFFYNLINRISFEI